MASSCASSNTSTWAGTVASDDTALAVTDTGGTGRPVIYLNGGYASQRHRPVIDELGTGYRPAGPRRSGRRTTPSRHWADRNPDRIAGVVAVRPPTA
ncbi:alpha/beta fold hydrolase [Nocardia abscessus]|uniref:alpha/beta fold hydrolase n=1 Tax=Nocardia abscessus TaxID=120957 RepID=UPI001E315703|nr:hypothetical protein [Nocardia abscessus]